MVKKFVFLALSGILLASCNSNELEFDNIKVQPITGTYSFPLGEVSYTMRELILNQTDGELEFQVDEDSLITLVYQDTFSYQSDTDFLQIDDISQGEVINLTSAIPATGPGSFVLAQSFTLDYPATDGDDTVDSVFYDTGDVTVNVTTDINATVDYTFTLNNFITIATETPLVISGSISGGGTSTETRPLTNRKSILSDGTFITDFESTVTLAAGESFTGTESLSFEIVFANQSFSVAYGKFGQDTVQVDNQTLDIEFFAEMGEEGLFFGNPQFRFFIDHTFGIPLGLDFSTLYGDDGAGGQQTFLSGSITETLPVLKIGDINNPGSSVKDTVEINSENSSIVNLLSTSPSRLGFDITGISNPYDQNAINFVSQTNMMDGIIEVEIPMEVKLIDLQQSGTLSLGGGLDISNVDSAFIRILTVNGLPFSATLDLEIQDADSNALYTVADNMVLNAPFINVNGFVTDPNGISADVPLSSEGIEALGTGSHLLLTITLNTPGSLNSRDIFVKILADYAIEVMVGVGGTVNIDF